MPIAGRERETRALSVVRRTRSRSPGRTGFIQLISSTPGAPSLAEFAG